MNIPCFQRGGKLCLLAGVRRSNAVLLLESATDTHWLSTWVYTHLTGKVKNPQKLI
jgi:hypothetical protein